MHKMLSVLMAGLFLLGVWGASESVKASESYAISEPREAELISPLEGTVLSIVVSIVGTIVGGIWSLLSQIPLWGVECIDWTLGWVLAGVVTILTLVVEPAYAYCLSSNVLSWGKLILHSAGILILSLPVIHLLSVCARIGIFILDFTPLGGVHALLRVAIEWNNACCRNVWNCIPVL